MSSPRVRRVDLLALAALAYIPFLLSSPGKVSGDTKQYLYLDPGRLLSRAVYLWDSHIGTGTVPHQNVGYLFPLGPYYWVMDQLGVPDWVAQRLFLGSISFAAAAGALWLFTMFGTKRVGAVVGAIVYLLTPYQLAFTARLSVLLLPWAGLPWLIGLTIRAARRGGWRDPALFALVILLIGSTNASSLVFVGIAPLLWLVITCAQRDLEWRRALAVAGRVALLSIAVSLWWMAGLRTQARYGIPVLDVTETLEQVADASRPADLLRGFGNWFLSGGDRVGSWLDQAPDYADSRALAALTLLVPVAGLVAAAFVRWKHRVFLGSLVVVGTIVGVGAWPYEDPSIVGDVFKSFAGRSAAGAALRNTPRVGPVIVLGLAGLIAGGVAALSRRRAFQLGAAAVVVAVVALAFLPVWRHGYLSERIERAEDIPQYWHEVADALDAGDDGTRALELPGSLFAAYRWGNTVDPVTPGLTDRPWVARELMPFGTRGSVDLLAALDRRFQHGTVEPDSLAPVLRLLGVGTVVARNDLEYERYDTPRPRDVWRWLTDPLAPGLQEPTAFGSTDPNFASIVLPLRDESELRSQGSAWPPNVALFDVTDARPIVSAASVEAPLVLEGDGEGVVDAAAAGFVGGDGVVLYGASLDDQELARAIDDEAELMVTDTNRRRARRWNRLRDDVGLTERSGQQAIAEDADDFRFEIVEDQSDRDRTVVEQRGGRVDATAYGDKDAYLPSERPALAFDGDVRTAWRTAGGRELDGDRLVLELDDSVRTDGITFTQPSDASRLITKARVQLDDRVPFDVALDESSRAPEGQHVPVPAQQVRTLTIEPLESRGSTRASAGFADIGLTRDGEGEALVDEVVRVPTRLLRRAGASAGERALGFVFSRSRYDPAERGGFDEEQALVREFELPKPAIGSGGAGGGGGERGFEVSGAARVAANAPDDVLDRVLGTTTPGVVFRASGHRAGDAGARASRAFDGDDATAWDSPFSIDRGEWLEAELDGPTTVEGATIRLVTDGLRSVPTRVRVEADGAPVATVELPAIADTPGEGSSQEVPFRFGPVTATRLRFVVESARVVPSVDDRTLTPVAAPVGIAELGMSGVPQAPVSAPLHQVCRDDLVSVDSTPLPVRMTAESGLEACNGPVALDAGSHLVRARTGVVTGIDVDRLVLTSGASGVATPVATFAESSPAAGARVQVTDEGATTYDLRVHSDGQPFWLVLGQSLSDGWKAELDGRSLGEPRLVNGYANGWLIDPGEAGTYDVTLRWTPQNVVWIAMALSVLAILVCLGVVVATRRAVIPVVVEDPELSSPLGYEGVPGVPPLDWRAAGVSAAVAGLASALVSRWWIGALVAVATVVAARVRGARLLLTAGAPLALVIAKAADAPELGWLAVLLFAADLLIGCVRHPRIRGSGTQDRDQAPG